MQRKLYFLFFLLTALIITASSQQDPVDALKKLEEDYPQEKIYIWFNRSAYVAGETIWFKAYVFSGYNISLISTSIYIELYDAGKKLVSSRIFPLFNGVAEGSIDLETKLAEGIYYIRAYTRWMLNFDETFQYIHPFPVYNSNSLNHLILNSSIWKAAVFVEGGTLVDGIETKIAVRRYSAMPLDNKWGGYLFEEGDPSNKLKEFHSLDQNVGLFTFTPETGKKYYVKVVDERGAISQICSLPVVNHTGVNFSISEIGDSISYRLRFQNIRGAGYSIIGQIQHQLAYRAEFKNVGPETSMKIPTKEFGNGILHLTVFDQTNKPVAERLVFVNHHKLDYDSNGVSQQMLSQASRSISSMQINIDSISWINYGAYVGDATAPSSIQEETILSSLWLTSDLTNPLSNAASYFRQPDKNKIEALDAIMISEKWNRFNWDKIINNKYPQIIYEPLKFLSYSGKVMKGNKLKPLQEVTLLLSYPDSTTGVILTNTDSAGNIVVDNLFFFNELKIFYQLNNKKGSAKFINIDFERNNKFVPYSLDLPKTPYVFTSSVADNATQTWMNRTSNNLKLQKEIDNKYKSLQEVVIQSRIKTPKEELDEKLSSPLFRNRFNETIFDFVNENQTVVYLSILEWLIGRVPGLSITRDGEGWLVPVFRGGLGTVYIDEMPADPSWYNTIPPNNIAMVKIIRGPFPLRIGSGLIAIYTKRGNTIPVYKEPSLPGNTIKGYDSVKKFILPDYKDRSEFQPDNDTRDQLLWQTQLVPTVEPDKTKIVFFNNDNAKQFKVIIQGFTHKGIPVYYEKIIEAR